MTIWICGIYILSILKTIKFRINRNKVSFIIGLL